VTALAILIVNEPRPRAQALRRAAAQVGHVAEIAETPPEAGAQHADVVVVGRDAGDERSLELVARYARPHASAVVASVPVLDEAYALAVALRGAHALLTRPAAAELGSAVAIAWARFDEYRRLLAAFDRRAEIEQAKGILMARHAISADRAFALLRRHSQRSNRKVVEIARAIAQSHALLLAASDAAAVSPSPAPAEAPPL
jgi:AmiR/NasT family two-component response regulator